MKKKKILVVEDDSDARWGLCRFLEKEGYEVIQAEDGAKAYSILSHDPVDVIISDLKMPEMDGLELFRLCKKNQIPSAFVMMTAHGDCESYTETISHGAIEYLNKPVSLSEVLALLKKIEGGNG